MQKRPAAVELATWLLWTLVVAGLVMSVLVVVFRDDLADAWSPASSDGSTVRPLEFVPVILVLYVVVAVLAVTLIPLMRHGHNWARHSLASIVVGILFVTVATVRTSPPTLFRWLIIVAAVLSAVSLVFLWHPQSRRHCLEEDGDGGRSEEEDGAGAGDSGDAGDAADAGDAGDAVRGGSAARRP
ncbi:hypothetical protein [Nocardioides sp. TF02-7]|uniref:hypothetical protein n=1 Tax=Nocardioides sp. TF02-7 TaxID=2917724 RepID=UPI001F063E34|nr:hypothetical protein [Nocardioides sp. TF02-7]UMG92093.1 hypothetical protein MF408_19360 [Nocardioides sp. TF02-7]